MRARLDRLGEELDVARNADEFVRRKTLYECVSSLCRNQTSHLTDLRALEGIKNKLQLLSECPAGAEGVEKEGNRTAVCDLADDLRDAIVEYQVRNNTEECTRNDSLTVVRSVVFAAEGDLRAEL